MHRQRKILNQAQVNELQVAQDNSPDGASAMRFQAVRLYGTGYGICLSHTVFSLSQVHIHKQSTQDSANWLGGVDIDFGHEHDDGFGWREVV